MTPRALAIGSVLGSLLLAPVVWANAGKAITTLDHARVRTATLAAVVAAPPPTEVTLLAGGRLVADDPVAAQQALARRLRSTAARSGVLMEQMVPAAHAAPVTGARIVVTGTEAAVIDFARTIESGDPIVRFASWHLDRSERALRLRALAVALRGGA